ncbi:MAG: acetyl-CoA carboxylase biotin carboxyl carrier protein [Nitrospirae bacterium]|nr:acetyl-CoA carboxylase biotin carboxyl carrier protein [Nitrospirota bacterium]MBF0535538.1 acetyl-CoA carboxylase biotin carboxyl carrier protein [Nitrospirota bacterium]MBF0617435.1 acetyl-CoA carboxylase biotin carboxyl carrier protein [Nitrospirota bacterium]
MDLEKIKELSDFLKETDITEFFYEEDGLKLKIRRGLSRPAVSQAQLHTEAADTPKVSLSETVEEDKYVAVKSPIVGTFYRCPSPGAPNFVELGDKVKSGQVLCIVEAMKLMNEIESECDGEIVKIFHESETSVEYGESLFHINPL